MKIFKILSWNILGPKAPDILQFQNRYENVTNWEHRFKLLTEKIISFEPDIICLQEIDPEIKNNLTNILKLHDFFESSYEPRGETGGVIVFHKNSTIELIKKNNIQLTTESKLKNPGAAAWATLLCKKTQQKILACSLHLHWELGLEQLSELMQSLENNSIPIFLAGDFNIKYKTMLEKIILNLNKSKTVKNNNYFSLFEHSSWTTQPPHNQDPTCWESLDHIIFSNDIKIDLTNSFVGNIQKNYQDDLVKKAVDAIKDNSKKSIPSDICPSDHLPIIMSFYLK